MSWQAAQWAMTMAPLPSNDPPARAVLAYLGVKADQAGRSAFPLALSIAHDVGLSPQVVPRVLKRLVEYGLISKDGVGPQGQPRWSLNMDRCHPEGSFEAFCDRHREVESSRKAEYRQRNVSTTLDTGQSHSESTGHGEDVPYSESSCPVSGVVMSRTPNTDVPYSGDPQINQHQPIDQSEINHATPSARPAPDGAARELELDVPSVAGKTSQPTVENAFERFWASYPRKVGKKPARTKFERATKQHDPEKLIDEAQRWADLWKAAGVELRFIPHPTTWLAQERWEDEPPSPRQPVGHQSYRDPHDQSVYDQPL